MISAFTIKWKKTHGNGVCPIKIGVNEAGWDLLAAEPKFLYPGARAVIDIGIAIEIPSGWYGQIQDRSGRAISGLKTSGGVVDSSYRGTIKVIIQNMNSDGGPINIGVGDKIAQIVFLPVPEITWVEGDLNDTSRGESGFGSSGN